MLAKLLLVLSHFSCDEGGVVIWKIALDEPLKIKCYGCHFYEVLIFWIRQIPPNVSPVRYDFFLLRHRTLSAVRPHSSKLAQ